MTNADDTPHDATPHEVMSLLDAGRNADALAAIKHLADETTDPALRRELEDVLASGRSSTQGFRKSWDRVYMLYMVGR